TTRHRFVLRRCISSRETRVWRTSAAPSTGFYHSLNLSTALEALPLLAFPLLRAPVSEARKSGILASPKGTCKRYFDKRINDA
ncbi:hypothetical protein, partial [Paraburkholderia strydomiana]|uniref:hypothetical protein n=1 Tax=Paraburkholderia strydomiana TaxID=1245417 RepID=UPI0038BDCD76